MVTEQFKKMALSFEGGDGGNLQSEVWVCGLEWGGQPKDDSGPEMTERLSPASWAEEDFKGSWNNQYNRKICWFLNCFYQLNVKKWDYEKFVKDFKILHSDSEGRGFKMNMLPFSFPGRGFLNWTEKHARASGFPSFEEYRKWCVEHRGAFFRRKIDENQPRVVVCTGVGERGNFIRFFTAQENFSEIRCNGFNLYCARYKNTLICVSPFFGFGKYCINSHVKMKELAERVEYLLENNVI